MANPDAYADFVEFTVSIVAGSQVGASLSKVCLISTFEPFDAFLGRFKDYTGTANQIRQALLDDGFTLTSAAYRMADAFLLNVQPIGELRIARRDADDADLAASLAAIIAAEDGAGDDFFAFCIDTRLKAEQKYAFEWAQLRGNHYFITYTRDPSALVGDVAALPYLLKALGIRQGMLIWYDPGLATKYGPAVLTSSPGTFDVPSGGTLILAVDDGADQLFTFNSAPAVLLSGTDGPYVLSEGDQLIIRVNSGPLLTVSLTGDFEAEYFPNGFGAASAVQVAAFLNDMVPGIVASAVGLKIQIVTEQRGTGAHLEVFSDPDTLGSALVAEALDLPFSEFQQTTGTIVPSNGAQVGYVVDALDPKYVISTASASGTAVLLADAWNDDPVYFAVATALADGDDVRLTFKDHSAHTVASHSPGVADITPIVLDNAAVDAEVDGTGFAVNAAAATSAEVSTLINLTLTDATAAAFGARFKVTTASQGEANASIEVSGGSLVEEFGLELGEVLGVGTQENYLDCQIAGRVMGFDLDAPDGSVGFVNQTVPQTPGNILTNTQRKAVWNQNCNTYEKVTSNRPGELHPGVCPAGFDADVPVSAFWFRVRGTERVKRRQDVAADRGERIPYDEEGVSIYAAILRTLMQDGARNGHIQGPDLLPKDPLGVRVTYFKTPTIAEQTPSNRAKGVLAGFDTLQRSRGSAKAVKIALTIQTP